MSAPILSLPSGQTQFNITVGRGQAAARICFTASANFNVPNNNIANFLNNTGLPTSNILGRVTGGNISNIFGTIQTTGFGNANLFLMNPAGFLFGPNATVNVGGMVAFTSADYLRLADGARFNAIPNASADALLSAAPVAAFGFLGSNPGAITVQGSQLTVAEAQASRWLAEILRFRAAPYSPERADEPGQRGQAVESPIGGRSRHCRIGRGRRIHSDWISQLGHHHPFTRQHHDSAQRGPGLASGSVVIRGGQLVMNGSSIKAGVPFLDQSYFGGTIEVSAEQVTILNHSTVDASVGSVTLGCPIGCGRITRAGNITFNVGSFSSTDSAILATVQEAGASGSQGRRYRDNPRTPWLRHFRGFNLPY